MRCRWRRVRRRAAGQERRSLRRRKWFRVGRRPRAGEEEQTTFVRPRATSTLSAVRNVRLVASVKVQPPTPHPPPPRNRPRGRHRAHRCRVASLPPGVVIPQLSRSNARPLGAHFAPSAPDLTTRQSPNRRRFYVKNRSHRATTPRRRRRTLNQTLLFAYAPWYNIIYRRHV